MEPVPSLRGIARDPSVILKHPLKAGKSLANFPARKLVDPCRVAWFSKRHPELGEVIRDVRTRGLTYLAPRSLVDLSSAVLALDQRGIAGAIVEAGTALGGSAIVLARTKRRDRPMWIFDAFGMIPPPTDNDDEESHKRYATIASGKSSGIGDDDVYYGYHVDLLREVTQTFVECGVEPRIENITFVKGYYEDTMRVNFPVALAHLDCDWYESVMICLKQIEPHLVSGGRFVIDDYSSWSGCTAAVNEFFAGRADFEFVQKSRLHIIKRS
ncbi:MAG TPA: TylF/MycF/NovP-related O-methyltransferase [Gaiella sp.]|jgi:asparagine synthase (glutamine-hydrolysing)